MKNQELEEKLAASKIGGGQKRIDAQHQKGKLTARERIELLLDTNSFEEIGGLVTHRSTNFGLDKNQILRRWCCYRFWDCNRSINLCLFARFYSFGRIISRSPC